MITQDLGIATAYGYAKSKGYTGTEAEFAELMASYASTAQTAIEAADRAVEANTAAQSAKISAQSSASTASTAAQTATSKALEAVTAADTATTKASEASQSATSASQSAESAGTSAQTATTAAATATTKASEASESAATATAAKTDAETARDAAAQSASEAAESAESIDPDEFDRKIYAAFATDIATGAIASFPDGADSIPMKDVLAHIEPVQAGSGDPSPDNVRPITGWTGAKVTRTGKNLLEMFGKNENNLLSKNTFVKAGTYIVSTSGINGNYATYVRKATTEGSIIGDIIASKGNQGNVTFTLEKDTNLMVQWYAPNDSSADLTGKTFQLELGSTATDYEPYSGQIYDITFPSEAGTVYGGTLDVTKGELVVDRAMETFNWENGIGSTILGDYARKYFVPAKKILDVLRVPAPNISNVAPMQDNWAGDFLHFYTVERDNRIYFYLPIDFDSSTTIQIVYFLANPITYQLTPQEITSLLGTNSVWADTGDSDVEYRADTKMYIARQIADAVSALS